MYNILDTSWNKVNAQYVLQRLFSQEIYPRLTGTQMRYT